MIGKLLRIILAGAIACVALNDAARYAQARFDLHSLTADVAAASAEVAKQNADRNATWQAGESYAEKYGATVYGFDMQDNRVYVWTRAPVHGTWVLQRVNAVLERKPGAFPLTVQDEATSIVH